MFKNICAIIGVIYAFASGGAGGWWYFAANEARHQLFDSLLSNTESDAQRIISNTDLRAQQVQEQLRTFTATLQTEIHRLNAETQRLNAEVRRLTDARVSDFRQVGAQLNPSDKKELFDKLDIVQRAAEASTIQTKEHYDRGVQIERMNNKWATFAIGVALALCAFARLIETTMSDAIPQMFAIGATWSIYCVIITNERISIEWVCMTLILSSGVSTLFVKLWKNHGNAIKAAIREMIAVEKRSEIPPRETVTVPVMDLVKLQAEANARQETMEAARLSATNRADALLRAAELARGPAPPYSGTENRTGHYHMRHTGYQPEYPQYQGRGETFTPRGYPS